MANEELLATLPVCEPPVLEIQHFRKVFGGTVALDDVSVDIDAGQVHGLLGHNGSGKSTLIKVLAGYHVPESGSKLRVRGNPEPLPLEARRASLLGLAFVHQDLALIPTLSVLDNMRVPQWGSRRGLVHWRYERQQARAQLEALDLDIDVDRPIASLNKGERALVAIARAAAEIGITGCTPVARLPGVLVLDEPTVFLSQTGRERLFKLVRRVALLGAGVMFVSHDLDEVLKNTDVITVLRDGRVVGHRPTADVTREDLVRMIVGHHQVVDGPSVVSVATREPFARVHLALGGTTPLVGVDFELLTGEILGATGLLGSGFDELPYLLFGAQPADSGRMALAGRRIDLSRLEPALAIELGLGLIPSNRVRDGGIFTLPIFDNIMMLSLGEGMSRGGLSERRLIAKAATDMTAFDVRPDRPSLAYGRLSGGNQQKALLAKWLRKSPKLLLLDEPTQGVDVGARKQIVGQLRSLCRAGAAILYCSADHGELAQVCDRVLIFRKGRLCRILSTNELTKERITLESIGATTVIQQ